MTTHNHDTSYASINHTHNDYALTTHNHDSSYAGINHTHSINDITDYEPIAGADGKSAFECWSEQQPVRYAQDGCSVIPYTMNEYIAAITGPVGPQGPKGDTGERGPKGEDADSTSWFDWLNGALNAGDIAAIAGLQNEISSLQTALASVQTQIAGILGTTSVSGPANDIIEAADDLSEFSEVGQSSRNVIDSLSDWFSAFRNRIAGQTNSYQALVNDYTSPSLSSVSNESALYLLGDGMTL